jgi:type II secretory pathway pseudopilin PulG
MSSSLKRSAPSIRRSGPFRPERPDEQGGRHRLSAFTLIELVVIAINAVLINIVLPSQSAARDAVRASDERVRT